MNSPKSKDLLARAEEADEAMDYITDYLAHLNNEDLEKALSTHFEAVSRFIWDIQEYLQEQGGIKQ